ncbi:hypothetical protein HYQ46_013016 [Verticillium longisporum]|nr:hypothetical protein HYQ46_013016 [Verticillium longisporum]
MRGHCIHSATSETVLSKNTQLLSSSHSIACSDDIDPTYDQIIHTMAGPGPVKPGMARGLPPLRVHNFVGTALGAGMWFFLMYRAKKDGAVLLGWKHPWDH